MTLDRNIGIARVDARPTLCQLANFVADRVFDLECDEVETRKRAFGRRDIDANGPRPVEPVGPGHRIRGPIDIIFAAIARLRHLPEHAAGDPALEVDAVAEQKIADELYTATDRMKLIGAQLAQFVDQDHLQAAWASREKLLHRCYELNCRPKKRATETVALFA